MDAHALSRQGWTISAIVRHLGRDTGPLPQDHPQLPDRQPRSRRSAPPSSTPPGRGPDARGIADVERPAAQDAPDPASSHEVHGAIRATWAALGWERSRLGYLTSNGYAVDATTTSPTGSGLVHRPGWATVR